MFGLSADFSNLYSSYYKHFYKPKAGSLGEFIDYFSQRNPGLKVVQVGANDGFNHDPIHKFIRRDKWEGVLLEPQPTVFEKYLKKLHRNTKGIHTINAALDYENGSRPIYKLAVSESRWATGLSSFNRSMLDKAVESGHIDRQLRKEGKPLPPKKEDYIQEVPVPCITSETLLEKYKIGKPDFLQIDTEGFDYEIIKMFNIPKVKPRVIVYENHNLSSKDKQECREFLQAEGYRLKDYAGDTLAVHQPPREYERFFQ